ncbi:myotubularin [Plectosphaerella plurivora]|uniref:Myotubularin n=1 Tax=Plectosphaerella plurivora TaxID=936078 RepID=A0A9P9A883_9PEZI|nr:myotubularin [Plectosphaerella plurivora]
MDVKKLVHDVQCINGGLTSNGTLRLTDYHLVFSGPAPEQHNGKDKAADSDKALTAPPKNRESWITYTMIAQCTMRPTPASSGIPSSIRLRCRDFIFVAFNFPDDTSAREVFDFIKSRTCKLSSIQSLYAFNHKPAKPEQAVDGWGHYDPKAEFRRQGISEKSPDKGWRISWVNKDYTFCDTYPAMLVVPSSISDNVLKYGKEYRSRCRIPALSYLHPVNGCSITRCSQPMTGVTRRSNIQDEKLVAASWSVTSPGSAVELPPPPSEIDEIESRLTEAEKLDDEILSSAPVMYDEKTGRRLIYGAQQSNLIVDARPVLNAMVNQVQGMGSEPMDRYSSAKKVFLNIENIHVMRNSLNKVYDALKDADLSPLSPSRQLLASSDWLKHTRMVLQGSSLIARQVGIQHSHVLIHCSDGWDRTSQLSALSQLMLDPYYRTLDGFITLVEKDWLSFGHMFRLRSGHLNHDSSFVVQKDGMAGATIQPGDNDGRSDAFQNAIASARRFFAQNKDDGADADMVADSESTKMAEKDATVPKMVSPVFHQFLDCVYQMLRQFPNRFEFNERFLRRLLYHLYSCQYGTFLYNSEKQRHVAKVSERTASVWCYFLARRPEFTNKDYDAVVDDHDKERERIIIPDLENIRWWHQSFNRTDEEMNGDLNAAAAAQISKASAMANFQPSSAVSYDRSQPGTPPRDGESSSSKPPPSLPTTQSLVGAVETPYATLTPEPRGAPTLHRSVSAENAGAFSALREGIGRGVSALTALGARASPSEPPTQRRTEQELHQMT